MTTDHTIRLWLAAYTAPGAEIDVRDRLIATGYQAVVPVGMVEMTVSRRSMLVDRPVFPRYAFVGIPHGVSWYPVKAVRGVTGILAAKGEPRPVSPRVIDFLRSADQAQAWTRQAVKPFAVGDQVCVGEPSDPLSDMVGRVLEVLPDQRIEILFNLFGAERKVRVAVDKVRAA